MWLILSLVSVFFSSATSLLQKKILLKENALTFSSSLAFYVLFINVPFFLIFSHEKIPGLLPLGIIAVTSILGGIAFLLVTESAARMDVSEFSPLMAIGPAITALFGFAFLGELLTLRQVCGIVIIIIGVYILELKRTNNLLEPFKILARGRYVHFILVALLLYACTDVLGKIILSTYQVQPDIYLFYYQLFTAIFFLILILLRKQSFRKQEHQPRPAHDFYLIIIVALFTIAYRYAHISAMQLAPIGITIAVFRSSTVITTILGGKIYNEDGLARKILASLIVVGGVILIAL